MVGPLLCGFSLRPQSLCVKSPIATSGSRQGAKMQSTQKQRGPTEITLRFTQPLNSG